MATAHHRRAQTPADATTRDSATGSTTWRSAGCSVRTNAIESLHSRYRRAVTVRGHFPTEQAALKCLYLVTRGTGPQGHRTGTMGHPVEARPERIRDHLRRPHAGGGEPLTMNAGNTVRRTLPSSLRITLSSASDVPAVLALPEVVAAFEDIGFSRLGLLERVASRGSRQQRRRTLRAYIWRTCARAARQGRGRGTRSDCRDRDSRQRHDHGPPGDGHPDRGRPRERCRGAPASPSRLTGRHRVAPPRRRRRLCQRATAGGRHGGCEARQSHP